MDTVSADTLGVDLLSECETANFPPLPDANPFTVTGTLSGNGDRRRLALSRTRFRLRPERRVTVRLGLPTSLRRGFAQSGRLSLRLVARVRDPAGAVRSVSKLLIPRR